MCKSPRAFTLVELIVVCAIMIVLVAMLLPAVKIVVEAAHRAACANNMRQIGIALAGHLDEFGSLPPGAVNFCYLDPGPFPPSFYLEERMQGIYKYYNHATLTFLLPYLERDDAYAQIDFSYPTCDAPIAEHPNLAKGGGNLANRNALRTDVRTFVCPACDRLDGLGYASTNYLVSTTTGLMTHYDQLAVKGMFGMNGSATPAHVTDGASNTIALAEVKDWDAQVPLSNFGVDIVIAGRSWGFPQAVTPAWPINYAYGKEVMHVPATDPRYLLQHREGYGSWHGSGANFLFADGAVRYLSNGTPVSILRSLADISDGGYVGSWID